MQRHTFDNYIVNYEYVFPFVELRPGRALRYHSAWQKLGDPLVAMYNAFQGVITDSTATRSIPEKPTDQLFYQNHSDAP